MDLDLIPPYEFIPYKVNGLGYPHKVDYNPQSSHTKMSVWLKANCTGKYLHSPMWDGTYIEFELEHEAVLFALKWA